MIVFYTHNQKVIPLITEVEGVCDSICSASCVKPKSKCCNKYKKKGVNCKRCPLSISLKAVS